MTLRLLGEEKAISTWGVAVGLVLISLRLLRGALHPSGPESYRWHFFLVRLGVPVPVPESLK